MKKVIQRFNKKGARDRVLFFTAGRGGSIPSNARRVFLIKKEMFNFKSA